ncbi:sporulation protein YjcZ [Evansella sp. AB-P1]|nr:sporulation protein YjcZ [Evansella sp. AB-P1]MDG5786788.1 sporulation protein YjcZ [Evansella sp. AB-P1]
MTYPAGKGAPAGETAAPATTAVGGFAFIIVMFVLLAIIGAVIVGAY